MLRVVGEEPEVERAARHVLLRRFDDRLAHVHGFPQGQLVEAGLDPVRHAMKGLLAFRRAHPRPRALVERSPCGLDGARRVGPVTLGDLGDVLVVYGADRREGGAVDGVDERVVDEVLNPAHAHLLFVSDTDAVADLCSDAGTPATP